MNAKSLLISVILALLFAWVALANSQAVRITLIFWGWDVPLFLVILISIMIGILFTGLISAVEEGKLLGKLKNLEKTLNLEGKNKK